MSAQIPRFRRRRLPEILRGTSGAQPSRAEARGAIRQSLKAQGAPTTGREILIARLQGMQRGGMQRLAARRGRRVNRSTTY